MKGTDPEERASRISDGIAAVRAISFVVQKHDAGIAYEILSRCGYGKEELERVRDGVRLRDGRPATEPEWQMVAAIVTGIEHAKRTGVMPCFED